jgi:hypothetical protein
MPEKKVQLYLPHGVPQITRGEREDEVHYIGDRDGRVIVPVSEVNEFIQMGCAHEPQAPVPPVNHIEPQKSLKTTSPDE